MLLHSDHARGHNLWDRLSSRPRAPTSVASIARIVALLAMLVLHPMIGCRAPAAGRVLPDTGFDRRAKPDLPTPANGLLATERAQMAAEDQKRAEAILESNEIRATRYRDKPLRPPVTRRP
ncbi:MAG: hypothetical protein WBE26_01245 [Phycisphaerae bacterium]